MNLQHHRSTRSCLESATTRHFLASSALWRLITFNWAQRYIIAAFAARWAVILPVVAVVLGYQSTAVAEGWRQRGDDVQLIRDAYRLVIHGEGARLDINVRGHGRLAPHPSSGLTLSRGGESHNARRAELVESDGNLAHFEVTFENGDRARLSLLAETDAVRIDVTPNRNGRYDICVRFAGSRMPAYGMGDHGGYGSNFNLFGFNHDRIYQHQAGQQLRFVSTFTIFPPDRLAMVLFDRAIKSATFNEAQISMGVRHANAIQSLWVFVGEPATIYARYRKARHDHGYTDREPDIRFFYPGFESYGALAWRTDQATVTDMLQQYVERGYPLRWAVVGSGFWMNPRSGPRPNDTSRSGPEGLTTSFGIWGQRYPNPDNSKAFLAGQDLHLIMGLRHGFHALPQHGGQHDARVHGPGTEHALVAGYFLTEPNGEPRTFQAHFPRNTPIYLLDPDNEQAVAWFVENMKQWGADGFKEDFMFHAEDNAYYDDAKLNPLLERLHDEGMMVMVRGAAYSVPGSILRINDTDIRHGAEDQDRIPINALAYAASGQPNVYMDIIAGRPIGEWSERERRYLTRMAMMSALASSMSFGNPPWHMESDLHETAALKAARWHARYVPYIHSEALRSVRSGYPHTMTPLPIAFPDDANTYDLASHERKQYQWLVGDSLLAAPPFGSDFDVVDERDVYLPVGRWMDYETGQIHIGGTTLRNFAWPIDKMPVFIGGKGILVVEADDGSLWTEIYPEVMDGRSYTYHHHADELTTTIHVQHPYMDAQTIRIMTDAGEPVQHVAADRAHAIQFQIEPGTDYQVLGSPR